MDWKEFLSWILNGTALKGAWLSLRETQTFGTFVTDAIGAVKLPGMGAKGAASFERPAAQSSGTLFAFAFWALPSCKAPEYRDTR